jgi:hypothetical protein
MPKKALKKKLVKRKAATKKATVVKRRATRPAARRRPLPEPGLEDGAFDLSIRPTDDRRRRITAHTVRGRQFLIQVVPALRLRAGQVTVGVQVALVVSAAALAQGLAIHRGLSASASAPARPRRSKG